MSHASRLLALLMSFQVAAAWAVPAAVLCVSGEGHVEIEAPESACCHPDDHAATPAVTVSTDDDCCGPCVDIAILDGPPAQSSNKLEAPTPPPVVALVAPPHFEAPRAPGLSSRPLLRAAPPPALRALRTIVLTC